MFEIDIMITERIFNSYGKFYAHCTKTKIMRYLSYLRQCFTKRNRLKLR